MVEALGESLNRINTDNGFGRPRESEFRLHVVLALVGIDDEIKNILPKGFPVHRELLQNIEKLPELLHQAHTALKKKYEKAK